MPGRVRLSELAAEEPLEDGRAPFAAPQPADPAPTPAAPAQRDPEPAAAAPAAPAPEPPPAAEPSAPTKRRAAVRSRAAEPARPARARQQPAGQPVTRSVPEGYEKATKPLQVFVDAEHHWALKDFCHLKRIDMRWVGSQLVAAFNHDPETMFQLMLIAEQERIPLGELLAPYLAKALAGEDAE